MRTFIFSLALSSIFLASCTNDTSTKEKAEGSVAATTGADSTKSTSGASSSVKLLLDDYLKIKNALSKDDDQAAAAAGKELVQSFAAFDKASLNTEEAKLYDEIEEDAREHAEHIGSNAGKIDHQREHFEILSKDLYDLVKKLGAGQKIYYTHCPMYNKDKGANWLSETSEIQNPYLGQSMPDCGTVKEELN